MGVEPFLLASSLLMQTAVDADFEKTGAFSSAAAGAAEAAEAAATAAASPSPSPCSSFLLPGTPPALTGAALGLFCACALISLAKKTARATPSPPLRVVVTGGSKGLGKALAREHLLSGDSVVVAARDWGRLMKSARELSEDTGAELVLLADDDGGEGEEGEDEEDEEAEEGNSDGGGLSSPRPTITPIACDVSDRASVARLVSDSLRAFGKKGKETGNGKRTIDCFYSNAGDSGGFRKFLDSDPESLARVVSTNLLGTVLCSRAAMEAMVKEQHEGPSSPSFGHIFLVEVCVFILSFFLSFPSRRGKKKLFFPLIFPLSLLLFPLAPGSGLRRARHARVRSLRSDQGRDGATREVAGGRGKGFDAAFAAAFVVVVVFFLLFSFGSRRRRLPRPQPGPRPHPAAPRRALSCSFAAKFSSFSGN